MSWTWTSEDVIWTRGEHLTFFFVGGGEGGTEFARLLADIEPDQSADNPHPSPVPKPHSKTMQDLTGARFQPFCPVSRCGEVGRHMKLLHSCYSYRSFFRGKSLRSRLANQLNSCTFGRSVKPVLYRWMTTVWMMLETEDLQDVAISFSSYTRGKVASPQTTQIGADLRLKCSWRHISFP